MSFVDIEFWICFIFVGGFYQITPEKHKRKILLVSSYCFYGAWDIRFLSLILLSTITDYICGPLAANSRTGVSRLGLSISLFVNLGLLFIFKYLTTFVLYLNEAFDVEIPIYNGLLSWGLPIGISFYTFQTLSYTLDCYRKKISPEKNFVTFSIYVSFFPQILAGPIERPKHLIPQFQNLKKISLDSIQKAMPLLFWGGFKKLYVADNIYPMVKTVFLQPQLNIYEVILSGFFVTLVVYCDFSAYSDLARGMARIFNIDLSINFKPFIFCRNTREFWQNWHITLTSWVRDYIFMPLVRSSMGRNFKGMTLVFAFLLMGFWHGPQFSWLLWGGVASGFFIFLRNLEKSPLNFSFITMPLMYVMYVLLGLLHEIRFVDLSKFLDIDFNSFGEMSGILYVSMPYLVPFVLYEAFIHYGKKEEPVIHWPVSLKGVYYGICSFCIFFKSSELGTRFVYFDF